MSTPILKSRSTAEVGLSLILTAIFVGLFTVRAPAQSMPREDVVEVPAIGEGLCVSNLFQSNMVLQRDKPIHVWGWADLGEEVTVKFAGEQASAKASKDRAWKVTFHTGVVQRLW